jgi:phosphoribosylformimino-5-aminoimidazole carboxamide ribotide isomerase
VFTVVPVIDLKGGLVVRARAGERASYAPIATPLAASADPGAVTRGYRELAPFAAFYVADLDAIEHRRPDRAGLTAVAAAAPDAAVWLDAGIARDDEAEAAYAAGAGLVVVGSESQRPEDPRLARRLEDAGRRAALSLDFRGDAFVGPEVFLADPGLWPERLIVMTLARVGTGAGPDFDRLGRIRDRAGPGRSVFAAGGVRHAADLERLKREGIAGALVATALHDGRITAADLAALGA